MLIALNARVLPRYLLVPSWHRVAHDHLVLVQLLVSLCQSLVLNNSERVVYSPAFSLAPSLPICFPTVAFNFTTRAPHWRSASLVIAGAARFTAFLVLRGGSCSRVESISTTFRSHLSPTASRSPFQVLTAGYLGFCRGSSGRILCYLLQAPFCQWGCRSCGCHGMITLLSSVPPFVGWLAH